MGLTTRKNHKIHEFEKNKPKGECPYCGYKRWRFYQGFHGNTQFGKCERINNCPSGGSIFYPTGQECQQEVEIDNRERRQILLRKDDWEKVILNQTSNFHRFCFSIGIPVKHLIKWKVGTKENNTVFIICDKNGNYVNKKEGLYKLDGKRDKRYGFHSLKQPLVPGNVKFEYKRCLYGEHLFRKGFTKKIVESEKTAVIMAWFHPKFDWCASGASSGLSDGKNGSSNIILSLLGEKVIWICDADKAGRNNSSIENLKKYITDHVIEDPFPLRDDGWDVADELISILLTNK